MDAEEEPGRLYEGSTWAFGVVNDWGLAVGFDALSELHPPPPRPLWRGRELQARRRWRMSGLPATTGMPPAMLGSLEKWGRLWPPR